MSNQHDESCTSHINISNPFFYAIISVCDYSFVTIEFGISWRGNIKNRLEEIH